MLGEILERAVHDQAVPNIVVVADGYEGAVDPTTRRTGAVYTQALPLMQPRVKGVVLNVKRRLYA